MKWLALLLAGLLLVPLLLLAAVAAATTALTGAFATVYEFPLAPRSSPQ